MAYEVRKNFQGLPVAYYGQGALKHWVLARATQDETGGEGEKKDTGDKGTESKYLEPGDKNANVNGGRMPAAAGRMPNGAPVYSTPANPNPSLRPVKAGAAVTQQFSNGNQVVYQSPNTQQDQALYNVGNNWAPPMRFGNGSIGYSSQIAFNDHKDAEIVGAPGGPNQGAMLTGPGGGYYGPNDVNRPKAPTTSLDYDDGGVIPEKVTGIGHSTGRLYHFGERGRERVIPNNRMDEEPMVPQPQYSQNQDEDSQQLERLQAMLGRRILDQRATGPYMRRTRTNETGPEGKNDARAVNAPVIRVTPEQVREMANNPRLHDFIRTLIEAEQRGGVHVDDGFTGGGRPDFKNGDQGFGRGGNPGFVGGGDPGFGPSSEPVPAPEPTPEPTPPPGTGFTPSYAPIVPGGAITDDTGSMTGVPGAQTGFLTEDEYNKQHPGNPFQTGTFQPGSPDPNGYPTDTTTSGGFTPAYFDPNLSFGGTTTLDTGYTEPPTASPATGSSTDFSTPPPVTEPVSETPEEQALRVLSSSPF